MKTLTKIKLQNYERSCLRNSAKRGGKKERDKRQRKDAKKLTKKGEKIGGCKGWKY